MRTLVFAGAAVVAANMMLADGALAQSKRKAVSSPWPKEPTAVLGLELGTPVDHYSLLACKDGPADPARYGFCSMFASNLNVGIGGIAVTAFHEGIIDMQGNIPTTMTLFGPHKNYQQIKAVLVERYGKPTRVGASIVQNMAGAKFDSETLEWVGRRVSLSLTERAGKIDTTAATFTFLPAAQQDQAREDAEVKSSAGKL